MTQTEPVAEPAKSKPKPKKFGRLPHLSRFSAEFFAAPTADNPLAGNWRAELVTTVHGETRVFEADGFGIHGLLMKLGRMYRNAAKEPAAKTGE